MAHIYQCDCVCSNRGLVYDNAMEQVAHQPDSFWDGDAVRVGSFLHFIVYFQSHLLTLCIIVLASFHR
jgi:hypothetical protein